MQAAINIPNRISVSTRGTPRRDRARHFGLLIAYVARSSQGNHRVLFATIAVRQIELLHGERWNSVGGVRLKIPRVSSYEG